MGSIIVNLPLNRVEGDLMVRLELEGNVVRDAWSSGVLFRGFENLLKGRGALDGLVITPRVCGICSTAHLSAACLALENLSGIAPTENAIRLRNIALMIEHLQSDLRHGVLMFLSDFTNSRYQDYSFFEEAKRRYMPFKGETVVSTIRNTRKLLEIVAIIGGQWPHSSFMVPGGICSTPPVSDLVQCRLILSEYRKWYESEILGCSIERWQDVRNANDLDKWLDEQKSHGSKELGFYIRLARESGLDRIGKGCGNLLSLGALPIPEGSGVRQSNGQAKLIPAGFVQNGVLLPVDPEEIVEDIHHSWYMDSGNGSRQPSSGETLPYASGGESEKYSWIKAPRFKKLPAETGPLAELILKRNPLILDLHRASGPNVFVRELARMIRSTELFESLDTWLEEIIQKWGNFYKAPADLPDGTGVGLTEATRGALGHWIKIEDGKIQNYQMIPPTSWNASPRDTAGVRGPWEEALIGTEVHDLNNPVEIGHVIRSFDACLVCSVHSLPLEERKLCITI